MTNLKSSSLVKFYLIIISYRGTDTDFISLDIPLVLVVTWGTPVEDDWLVIQQKPISGIMLSAENCNRQPTLAAH